MNIKSLIIVCGLAALSAGCVQAKPAYTLVEAEAMPQGTVKADPEASGGKYVGRDGAYQPLLIGDMPTGAGDSFVLWARLRGVAVQLKGIAADGGQHEFGWVWDKPAQWKWVSFGRHTRSELGTKILLLQGPDAQSDAGLDAVVFAAEDTFSPDSIALSLPPLPPVSVTLDWQKTVARATPISYGLNAFGGFNPDITQSAAYEANMAAMNAGLVRLHNGSLMNDSKTDSNGWIDTANRRWDVEKIKKTLSGAYAYGPALMINIPGWPVWMDTDKDGFLDADKTAAYAKFCAQLVKIINKDLGHHIVYWEVTNERDSPYYGDFHQNGGALKDALKPDRLAELAAIYNACAHALKAVDPTIKVGGPAAARPDWTDFITRFAAATAPNLDFFSYHAYASGSKDDSDTQIFNRTEYFGGATNRIVAIMKEASPKRPIPVFFDEYNISWTWETRDPRMTNVKGAIFDALTMVAAVTNGADATMAWNEKDGVYGKMDDSYHPRPSTKTFALFNRYLVGSLVSASTSAPEAVVACAVQSAAPSRKSVLLINRSGHDRSVVLMSQGSTLTEAKPWTRCALTEAGYAESKAASSQWAASPILLPAYSLTLFTSLP